MPKQICDKDHSKVLDELEKLPESQAPQRGRHRCAGCAYEAGFAAGQKAAKGPKPSVSNLRQSRRLEIA
jgi:hypothetical protein